MAITWDANFEASPKDPDEAKYGAAKIRELKLAISERLELEMNFKTGTQPLIKAGKAAVIYAGTTAEIAALTGMSVGALVWDTAISALRRYSTSWDVLSARHGALLDLASDDHTQYLHLDKDGQRIQRSVAVTDSKTIDGRDLSVDGAKLDTLAVQVGFGAWSSLGLDTVYGTDKDGFVCAAFTSIAQDRACYVTGYTDGSNPPTTARASAGATSVAGVDCAQLNSFTMPVKKGEFFKVAFTNITGGGAYTLVIYWIPLGS